MRKVIIMFALAMGIVTANAQENVTVGKDNGSEQPTLTKEVYPQKEADGDLYHGLTAPYRYRFNIQILNCIV